MTAASTKYESSRKGLPKDLQPVFDRFVEEYKYFTLRHYGAGYVAYQVLADLILAGWRPSAKAHSSSELRD